MPAGLQLIEIDQSLPSVASASAVRSHCSHDISELDVQRCMLVRQPRLLDLCGRPPGYTGHRPGRRHNTYYVFFALHPACPHKLKKSELRVPSPNAQRCPGTVGGGA